MQLFAVVSIATRTGAVSSAWVEIQPGSVLGADPNDSSLCVVLAPSPPGNCVKCPITLAASYRTNAKMTTMKIMQTVCVCAESIVCILEYLASNVVTWHPPEGIDLLNRSSPLEWHRTGHGTSKCAKLICGWSRGFFI